MSKDDEKSLNNKIDKIYQRMKESGVDEAREKMKVAMDIKLVNKSDNPKPNYESEGASGFDIRAYIPESITLGTLERAVIKTGLYFELPVGYEMQIRPRSGLAAKKGITVLNSPGTIDWDFRGEIGIILVNLSNEPFTINSGDRIAQGVIAHSLGGRFYNIVETEEELSKTKRGEDGFGSSGIK
jgi:dUTP pyrophosphatase